MDKKQAEARIKELRKATEYHAKKYYDEDKPEITDYEYDMMMNELKSLEKQFPELIDKESGLLRTIISETISKECDTTEIEDLFLKIVSMRNRIIHSFRITSNSGEQVLATKSRKKEGNIQFEITEEYLMDFIKKNEMLSELLHQYRGY